MLLWKEKIVSAGGRLRILAETDSLSDQRICEAAHWRNDWHLTCAFTVPQAEKRSEPQGKQIDGVEKMASSRLLYVLRRIMSEVLEWGRGWHIRGWMREELCNR